MIAAVPALSLSLLAQAGSDYILHVEKKLDSLGYGPGEVDGNFDAQLTNAIKRFQSEHGLIPNGQLTRETYTEISKAQPAQVLPPPQPAYAPPPPAPAYVPPQQAAATPAYSAPMPVAVDSTPPPEPAYAPRQPAPSTPARRDRPVPGAPSRMFGGVLELAFEFGGDKVATVNFSDGTSQNLNAGQGGTIAGGLYFRPASMFDLRATVGYKYATTAATNADITMTRVTSELSGRFWRPNGFWLGAGGVYHSNVSFDADGFGPNVDFDNAFGGQFELGWRYVALSYTAIEYTVEGSQTEIDASNFGVMLNYNF